MVNLGLVIKWRCQLMWQNGNQAVPEQIQGGRHGGPGLAFPSLMSGYARKGKNCTTHCKSRQQVMSVSAGARRATPYDMWPRVLDRGQLRLVSLWSNRRQANFALRNNNTRTPHVDPGSRESGRERDCPVVEMMLA